MNSVRRRCILALRAQRVKRGPVRRHEGKSPEPRGSVLGDQENFTDKDIYGAAAVALRKAGFDAVSAPEAARLGESDDSQV